MIKIQALKKSFGRQEVLKQIDLTFPEGSISGLVGANGAGKTTLFNCIAGLENYSGTIAYDGHDLKDVTGFLPATPYFLSKLTGYEYVQLFLQARGIRTIDINASNWFDLPLNQYAETYSTGMKKKLALMAILLQRNKVYILDEPFSGVDIQSNILIQSVLKKLKENGHTIILSSHVFETLNEVCDELHYLKAGEIVRSVPKGQFDLIEADMRGVGLEGLLDDFFSNSGKKTL